LAENAERPAYFAPMVLQSGNGAVPVPAVKRMVPIVEPFRHRIARARPRMYAAEYALASALLSTDDCYQEYRGALPSAVFEK
jgi:hypothetical protein